MQKKRIFAALMAFAMLAVTAISMLSAAAFTVPGSSVSGQLGLVTAGAVERTGALSVADVSTTGKKFFAGDVVNLAVVVEVKNVYNKTDIGSSEGKSYKLVLESEDVVFPSYMTGFYPSIIGSIYNKSFGSVGGVSSMVPGTSKNTSSYEIKFSGVNAPQLGNGNTVNYSATSDGVISLLNDSNGPETINYIFVVPAQVKENRDKLCKFDAKLLVVGDGSFETTSADGAAVVIKEAKITADTTTYNIEKMEGYVANSSSATPVVGLRSVVNQGAPRPIFISKSAAAADTIGTVSYLDNEDGSATNNLYANDRYGIASTNGLTATVKSGVNTLMRIMTNPTTASRVFYNEICTMEMGTSAVLRDEDGVYMAEGAVTTTNELGNTVRVNNGATPIQPNETVEVDFGNFGKYMITNTKNGTTGAVTAEIAPATLELAPVLKTEVITQPTAALSAGDVNITANEFRIGGKYAEYTVTPNVAAIPAAGSVTIDAGNMGAYRLTNLQEAGTPTYKMAFNPLLGGVTATTPNSYVATAIEAIATAGTSGITIGGMYKPATLVGDEATKDGTGNYTSMLITFADGTLGAYAAPIATPVAAITDVEKGAALDALVAALSIVEEAAADRSIDISTLANAITVKMQVGTGDAGAQTAADLIKAGEITLNTNGISDEGREQGLASRIGLTRGAEKIFELEAYNIYMNDTYIATLINIGEGPASNKLLTTSANFRKSLVISYENDANGTATNKLNMVTNTTSGVWMINGQKFRKSSELNNVLSKFGIASNVTSSAYITDSMFTGSYKDTVVGNALTSNFTTVDTKNIIITEDIVEEGTEEDLMEEEDEEIPDEENLDIEEDYAPIEDEEDAEYEEEPDAEESEVNPATGDASVNMAIALSVSALFAAAALVFVVKKTRNQN